MNSNMNVWITAPQAVVKIDGPDGQAVNLMINNAEQTALVERLNAEIARLTSRLADTEAKLQQAKMPATT